MKRPAILASIKEAKQVKIPVENPGILEVPEGEKISDLPIDHFKNLVEQKGWQEISKALVNLKVWNKEQNPDLSKWADKMQESLSNWVKERRKESIARILERTSKKKPNFDKDVMAEIADYLNKSTKLKVKSVQKGKSLTTKDVVFDSDGEVAKLYFRPNGALVFYSDDSDLSAQKLLTNDMTVKEIGDKIVKLLKKWKVKY